MLLTLSTTDWRRVTEDDLKVIAEAIQTDGCTGVADFYLCACILHDYWYRTGVDLDGVTPITRAEADRRFRRIIQQRSVFGRLSPMSWWRWAGVRLLGASSWKGA